MKKENSFNYMCEQTLNVLFYVDIVLIIVIKRIITELLNIYLCDIFVS